MAEWLFDAGIGENRAALIEGIRIVEAHIEPDGGGLKPGAVISAKLSEELIPGRRLIAQCSETREEVLVEHSVKAITPSRPLIIEITREAGHDGRMAKRARGRLVAEDAPLRSAPSLRERIDETDLPVTALTGFGPDLLADCCWDEMLEEAERGEIRFAGGCLLITPTPALTLIDVDGWLDPLPLALAAARAAGQAIRCFGIGGSIAIDFPTVAERKARTEIADALVSGIGAPCNHAGVNQFGLMHIVLPRPRASLVELIAKDRASHAARQLIRRASRSGLSGSVTLTAAPRVIAALEGQSGWMDQLARQLGGTVNLRNDAQIAMDGGHVSTS